MDLFLLICHRSERSEVKRSRESIDCHVAHAPRNDGALGAGDPLTAVSQPRDDREGVLGAGDPLTACGQAEG
ncbi:MAG: hypothetical protein NC218_12140 [Acetobacter sp.]|nr:hypothetical protein [Acetobacter sp.]